MKATKETYDQLYVAYRYLNARLFDGALPPCVLTLQRTSGCSGYFSAETWSSNVGAARSDEIALNPETFTKRSAAEVLSTLVHEMCHLQQHHVGRPGRRGYHNREWARMMDAVGLVPSTTGAEGGKRTGESVRHYIAPGGVFEVACGELLAKGFRLPWSGIPLKKAGIPKTRYTCPCCEVNAWAKPGIALACGSCHVMMPPAETEGPELAAREVRRAAR